MSKNNKRQASFSNKIPASVQRTDFNPDYTNTRRELKRIGILAASFIVILVVLSFFQSQLLSLFIK